MFIDPRTDGLLARIESEARWGWLIPVLGPGCHRIGFDDEYDPAWTALLRRVAAARNAEGRGASAQRFIDNLWRDKHSPPRRAEALGLEDPPPALPADETARQFVEHLTALQDLIIDAVLAATELLVHQLRDLQRPVIDWQIYGTSPIGVATDDRLEVDAVAAMEACLAPALDEALDLIELRTKMVPLSGDPNEDRPFGARGVWPDSPAELARSAALLAAPGIAQRINRLSQDIGERGSVAGLELEWLTDLVWHLFRFDSDVPPSVAELTFHLALAADPAGLCVRPEPGLIPRTVAGALIDIDATLPITKALTTVVKHVAPVDAPPAGGEHDATERQRFYDAIASRAHRNYHEWCERHEDETLDSPEAASDRDDDRPNAVDERQSRPPFPVILSTDYDLRLEQALQRAATDGERFHVAIPVRLQQDERMELRWLIATFDEVHADLRAGRWTWLHLFGLEDDESWFDREEAPADHLLGPIVVKLSGSPLHKLADTEGPVELADVPQLLDRRLKKQWALYENDRLSHLVVVSEFDHLSALEAEFTRQDPPSRLPSWLSNELDWRVRSWLIVGQRIRDWLPRLTLFFANSRGSRQTRTNSVRVAIDYEFDEVKASLLDWLNVERVEILAEELTDRLATPDQRNAPS